MRIAPSTPLPSLLLTRMCHFSPLVEVSCARQSQGLQKEETMKKRDTVSKATQILVVVLVAVGFFAASTSLQAAPKENTVQKCNDGKDNEQAECRCGPHSLRYLGNKF